MIQEIAKSIGLSEIKVTRDYRLEIDQPATAAAYLQGVNEATHGIADSLLSVLAPRANDILQDILAHRGETPSVPPQPTSDTAPIVATR